MWVSRQGLVVVLQHSPLVAAWESSCSRRRHICVITRTVWDVQVASPPTWRQAWNTTRRWKGRKRRICSHTKIPFVHFLFDFDGICGAWKTFFQIRFLNIQPSFVDLCICHIPCMSVCGMRVTRNVSFYRSLWWRLIMSVRVSPH